MRLTLLVRLAMIGDSLLEEMLQIGRTDSDQIPALHVGGGPFGPPPTKPTGGLEPPPSPSLEGRSIRLSYVGPSMSLI